MRPVTRALNAKKYSKYQDAIKDLEDCFGKYCSYCEVHLKRGLEVEHVAPKSRAKRLEKKWENFLIGCKACNTVKSKKNAGRNGFLWPDIDNTLKAFEYGNGGLVNVASGLSSDVSSKARKLMGLVGLDRHHGQATGKKPTKRDSRSTEREVVWQVAERYRTMLLRRDDDEIRDLVVNVAVLEGYFSVWMTVFSRDIKMRRRLIRMFKGTAKDCFNRRTKLVSRLTGRL